MRLDPEQVVEGLPRLPGVDQVLDARQGVAALAQLPDEPQAGEVVRPVEADPALPARRRQQALGLVEPDGRGRQPGRPDEVGADVDDRFGDAGEDEHGGGARRPADRASHASGRRFRRSRQVRCRLGRAPLGCVRGDYTRCGQMRRLNHPVYRGRTLQILADMGLCAVAFLLAFRLRFLDDSGGIPDRYWTLYLQSVAFVAVGKVIVFGAFGLYQKWWRYVSGRDFLTIVRAVAVSS